MATRFGRKTAIIRPIQNIYKVQYKRELYGIPYSARLYIYLLLHNGMGPIKNNSQEGLYSMEQVLMLMDFDESNMKKIEKNEIFH